MYANQKVFLIVDCKFSALIKTTANSKSNFKCSDLTLNGGIVNQGFGLIPPPLQHDHYMNTGYRQ